MRFPLGARRQLTFFPDRVTGASRPRRSADFLVFTKDQGGDEFGQIYRLRDLGFELSSAHAPTDVYSIDVVTGSLERWTESETGGLDASTFSEPELVRWKSFDGKTISGFLFEPDPRFTGPRPMIVNIHGRPEGQSRPGFQARWNYVLDELGVAMLYPNVRGSTGFGKSFVKLDSGVLREDSVKDIGCSTGSRRERTRPRTTRGRSRNWLPRAWAVMRSECLPTSGSATGASASARSRYCARDLRSRAQASTDHRRTVEIARSSTSMTSIHAFEGIGSRCTR